MEKENNSTSAKVVTALIIGLIIGFGAGAFWQAERRGSAVTEGTATVVDKKEAPVAAAKTETKQDAAVGASKPKDAATAAADGNAAILAQDQAAGDTALISQVISGEPVWVAVREEQSGEFGNILGVAKIPGGTHRAVLVELLRPTSAGRKYFVVLYRDVGEAAFNYREDILIEGVRGTFNAQ